MRIEEAGGLQSTGFQRVGHNLVTEQQHHKGPQICIPNLSLTHKVFVVYSPGHFMNCIGEKEKKKSYDIPPEYILPEKCSCRVLKKALGCWEICMHIT